MWTVLNENDAKCGWTASLGFILPDTDTEKVSKCFTSSLVEVHTAMRPGCSQQSPAELEEELFKLLPQVVIVHITLGKVVTKILLT